MADLPGVAVLAEIADTGLHPAVHTWAARVDRLAVLREELGWQVDVAGRDLDWARGFAAHLPVSGAPPAMYLNRWLPAGGGLTVLAGPRFERRDPARPFVEVVAADRLVTAADLPALRRLVRDEFAVFAARDVRVWTADPPGAWPGTRAEMRLVAAPLGQLRRRPLPDAVTVRPAVDPSWYDRYAAIHDHQVAADPAHGDRTWNETAADLDELRVAGLLFEVLLDGEWAGIVAAEPRDAHGLRGATVAELRLTHEVRGHGLGRHLSVLLARNLPPARRPDPARDHRRRQLPGAARRPRRRACRRRRPRRHPLIP